MSRYSTQQMRVMQNYNQGPNTENKEELKILLQSVSVEHRQHLLMNIKGGSSGTSTLLHRAAWDNDLDSVKYMLEGLTTDQTTLVLKIQHSRGITALHIAAYYGFADVLSYFLTHLTQQQRLDVLKVQDNKGNTALHDSANQKKTNTFQLILSLVSPDQQQKLLNMKNKAQQSVFDVAEPELFCLNAARTRQAVEETNKLVAELEKDKKKQRKALGEAQINIKSLQDIHTVKERAQQQLERRCELLERQRVEQTQELTEAREKAKLLQDSLVEQKKVQQQFVTRCTSLERQKDGQQLELKEAQDKVKVLENNFTKQKEVQQQYMARVGDLERQKVEQDQVNAEQTRKLNKQSNQLSVRYAEFEKRNAHLEGVVEKLSDAVAAGNTKTEKLVTQNKQLVKDNHEQSRACIRMTNEMAEYRRETSQRVEQMERMRVRQEEMQRLIEHLEIYIQTPFLTDATGDQELEELD